MNLENTKNSKKHHVLRKLTTLISSPFKNKKIQTSAPRQSSHVAPSQNNKPTPSKPKPAPFKPSPVTGPAPSKPSPVTGPVQTIPQQGTKRAILIGINYVSDPFNRLNGCINDVKNIKALLIGNFNYSPNNIVTLTDDQSDPTKIPTRANIIAAIHTAVSQTQPGDTLFLHYSGHGSTVRASSNDEQNNPEIPNQDSCICPSDFNNYPGNTGFIIDNELKNILVNKIPVGAKLRTFFDACHSGTMLDLEYVWRKDQEFFKQYEDEKQSNDILEISGCADSDTSADGWNAQKREAEGALTMMLIKALINTQQIKTTWKELLLLVRHYLASAGYSQVPQLSVADKSVADTLVDL